MKYTKDDLNFLKARRAEQHVSTVSMQGKTCVISGATSGVGLEASKRLAKGGAELILVCRDAKKADNAASLLRNDHGAKVHVVTADFSCLDDVRRAAGQIREMTDSLDVLINSAGLHCTRRHLTRDGNELVFQVNHVAPFLMTMLLLDLLIKSPQGRIIQVNSEGHRFGGLNLNDLDWTKRPYMGLRAYGSSKTAQIMTVMVLSERLKGTGVTINAMHPGGVRTNIGNNNGILYRAWLRGIVWHFLKDAAISGEALYYLSNAEELAQTSGRYFFLTQDIKPMAHAMDEQVRAAIWEKTLSLTDLPFEFLNGAIGGQFSGQNGYRKT